MNADCHVPRYPSPGGAGVDGGFEPPELFDGLVGLSTCEELSTLHALAAHAVAATTANVRIRFLIIMVVMSPRAPREVARLQCRIRTCPKCVRARGKTGKFSVINDQNLTGCRTRAR